MEEQGLLRVKSRKKMGVGGEVEEEVRKGALSLRTSTPESWIRLAHCPQSARGSGSQGNTWRVLCVSRSCEPQNLNLETLYQGMSGMLALSVLTCQPTIPQDPQEHQGATRVDGHRISTLWPGAARNECPCCIQVHNIGISWVLRNRGIWPSLDLATRR